MRFYSWFAFSAVSSVQCVVTFPCLAVLRQYPVSQQPHAEEGHEDSFHCNGLTLTTKFASKIAERAYCCGRPVPGRGNDFNVFHMETVTLDELQCKNVY
ncbi:hypothetical protein KEM48_008512 [Puccinia striiformis f. sp. tritici PST-130]|nr:hypothetical protein KEM48_008512 [Puccinia striiformis f. sp. tritici PST-130]